MPSPFPSLTATWHDKPYATIDPTRPELSTQGKVVAVTGGGGSVGAAIALAFARAGSVRIAVIGRRKALLDGTKKQVESAVPAVQVLAVEGNVCSKASIQAAFTDIKEAFGPVDILVAAAGHLPNPGPLTEDTDDDDWWQGFEVNTKGAMNTCRAFGNVALAKASLVNVSTSMVQTPAFPGMSGYISSKLAGTKVFEHFGTENPGIAVMHVHPGVIGSEMQAKSGIPILDEADLAGQFTAWTVSEEASFLRGKLLWSNWDVDELKARKEELGRPNKLAITLNEWPYQYTEGNIQL